MRIKNRWHAAFLPDNYRELVRQRLDEAEAGTEQDNEGKTAEEQEDGEEIEAA